MINVFSPMTPGVFAAQTPLVGRTIEGGLLFLARFGFVECLEKKQPCELLNVVARVHALRIELIAGALDDLLHFLPTVIDILGHVFSGCYLGSAVSDDHGYIKVP